MNKLGSFLKNERETRDISQAELGHRLGVHGQFVSNWERGRCEVPLKTLKRLVKVLQLGPAHIKGLLLKQYREKIDRELQS